MRVDFLNFTDIKHLLQRFSVLDTSQNKCKFSYENTNFNGGDGKRYVVKIRDWLIFTARYHLLNKIKKWQV